MLSALVTASAITSKRLSVNLTPDGLQRADVPKEPMESMGHPHTEQQRGIQGQWQSFGATFPVPARCLLKIHSLSFPLHIFIFPPNYPRL